MGQPIQQASDTSEQAFEAVGIPREHLPRHLAIIMDGNGRWAKQQGKVRMMGHQRGSEILRPLITECARLYRDQLTLYSFSVENWKRPENEIDFLMELCTQYLEAERRTLMDNNIQFVHLGRRQGLPQSVLDQIDKTTELTETNSGMKLAIALNYGARAEITDAVRTIAGMIKQGELAPDQITEQTISDHLYTAGMIDPDLLIRSAGEMRISNYLLWQISYAELWVTNKLWPEFTVDDLRQAMRDFAGRGRRFGDITNAQPGTPA